MPQVIGKQLIAVMMPVLQPGQKAPGAGEPINIDRPYISATSLSVAGAGVVSCTLGNWTNTPTSYTYQWNRNGVAITGGTAATYTLVAADVGNFLTCTLTAVNAHGSVPAISNRIGPVTA